MRTDLCIYNRMTSDLKLETALELLRRCEDAVDYYQQREGCPQLVKDLRAFWKEQRDGNVIREDPKNRYTHAVQVHAVGNPDMRQYGDLGPKQTVYVNSLEEAQQAVMSYQALYDMGGGNCAPEHGKVYRVLRNGKLKHVGEVSYSGSYETLAEIKAFEAEIKAKYGTK